MQAAAGQEGRASAAFAMVRGPRLRNKLLAGSNGALRHAQARQRRAHAGPVAHARARLPRRHARRCRQQRQGRAAQVLPRACGTADCLPMQPACLR